MEKKWPLDVTVSFDPYFGEPDRDGIQGAEVLPDGKVRVMAKVLPAGMVPLVKGMVTVALVEPLSYCWR